MKKIQRLELRDGRVFHVGQPYVDESGKPVYVPVKDKAEPAPVVIGAIRYVPEIEDYVDETETQKRPARYEVLHFVPLLDSEKNWRGGRPYPFVDVVIASDVKLARELWDDDAVLDAIRASDEDAEESDEDEAEVEAPADVPASNNGQPVAPSTTTTP